MIVYNSTTWKSQSVNILMTTTSHKKSIAMFNKIMLIETLSILENYAVGKQPTCRPNSAWSATRPYITYILSHCWTIYMMLSSLNVGLKVENYDLSFFPLLVVWLVGCNVGCWLVDPLPSSSMIWSQQASFLCKLFLYVI